jgi:PIN domain nuclease of toxin-antitoxin system
VASLPPLHSDPFDRILIAQAMSEPLHLVTTDAQLKQYSELVVLV